MSLLEQDQAQQTAGQSTFQKSVRKLAEAEVGRLQREHDTVASALASITEELRGAKRVLVAIEGPQQAAPKKKQGKVQVKNLSADRRERLTAWVKTRGEEEFTTADVSKAMGWPISSSTDAMNTLRAEGVARLARMGGLRKTQRIYRSMV